MSDIKKVVIVTPEFYGDSMVGGLAVSVHGLSHALIKRGVKIDVVIPAYEETRNCERFIKKPYLDTSKGSSVSIKSYSKEGIDIHKITGINIPEISTYADLTFPKIEDSAYRESVRRNFEAYQLVGRVIPDVLDKAELKDVDIIHLMEWSTASASFWLRKSKNYNKKPIVITSHNLNYIGEVPQIENYKTMFREQSPLREIRASCLKDGEGNLFGSLLELGIYYADIINTVSPSEAEEVLNGRNGVSPRLVELLNKKGLEGILNGIDPTIINPEIDHRIERYHTESYDSIARGKKENKIELNKFLNDKYCRKFDDGQMLISMMCRLVAQKSINEVIDAVGGIKELLEGVRLLIVGEPSDESIRTKISSIAGSKIVALPYFAEPELKHKILAASDAILQPSKWEPCGYTQLEGMVYGAIPIVTNIGGHKDTVKPIDLNNGEGYGLFIEPTKEGILKGIIGARNIFNQKELWRNAVMNAVKEDFRWSGKRDSVGKYLQLYERAIEIASSVNSKSKDSTNQQG